MVPNEGTPPNPYLSHIEDRDLTTTSGLDLTLMNPAYMTRQVLELGREQYGHQGHITSLNPIRPENAPDAWEAEALRAFEGGETEVAELTWIEDEEYLRLIRPMIVEGPCLKCHAAQGYQEGDIRGGISVSVPMEPLWALMYGQLPGLAMGYGFIWLLGMGGIGLGFSRAGRGIRERDRVEATVLESRAQLLALARRLEEVREREKTDLAEVLHDDLGQVLIGLRMGLSSLKAELPEEASPFRRRLSEFENDALSLVEDLNSICTGLRPPILDLLGLPAAIEWQVEELAKRSGLEFDLELDLGDRKLEKHTATVAFRLFQESLLNVLRHAEATRVRVSLHCENGTLVGEVRDNGRGIDPDELTSPDSVGLVGMRERARALDGDYSVEPLAGGGTLVRFRVPFREEPPRDPPAMTR